MGAWFRLRADFDISGFSAENQVILRALKTHGMVLADNGSSWFMSGAPDPRWNDSDLALLRNIAGSVFEAVDVSSLPVAPTSYAARGTVVSTTTTTTLPPPPTELVANAGFETGLGGWAAGNNRTTLARTCTAAHTGACAAELGRRQSTGDAVLDDSPNTVASSATGAVYAASAWVQAPAGRSVTLRLREYRGSKLVRYRTAVVTGTGSWQQVSVTGAPADGGTSISLDVTVSLPTTFTARVDDLSLRRL